MAAVILKPIDGYLPLSFEWRGVNLSVAEIRQTAHLLIECLVTRYKRRAALRLTARDDRRWKLSGAQRSRLFRPKCDLNVDAKATAASGSEYVPGLPNGWRPVQLRSRHVRHAQT